MSAKTVATLAVPDQVVRLECGFCERQCSAMVGHYDMIRCNGCGVAFIAFQPHRGSALVFFPWEGRTLDEQKAIHARWLEVAR